MADTDEARKLIDERQRDQAAMLVETFVETFNVILPSDRKVRTATALAAVLHALAEDWRTQAQLWETAKRKGWQSAQKELRLCAARVAGVAVMVEKLATEPKDDWTSTLAAIEALRTAEMDPPLTVRDGDVVEMQTGIERQSQIGDDALHEALTTDAGATLAYLRGDSDMLPGEQYFEPPGAPDDSQASIDLRHDAGPPSTPLLNPDASAGTVITRDDIGDPTPATSELNQEAKEMTMTFADPGAAMFADPDVPDWEPFKGASALRRSFGDLMRPAHPALIPEHLSHSQIEDLEGCGVKYRLSRLENLPRIPQWSLLGGETLHACAEHVERAIDSDGALWSWPDGPAIETLWSETFVRLISEQRATTPVPFDRWRASAGGKEGYDWWRVEGEGMLARYVDMRRAQDDGRKLVRVSVGGVSNPVQAAVPVLELELSTTIHGPAGNVPFKSILDQAWWLKDGAVLIADLKTGSRMPVDTFQLATQAWTLMQATGTGAEGQISGSYYNARKGTFTEPVDLFKAHTYDEFAYRVHTAAMKRNLGLLAPKRDAMCTACGVKYACPAFSRDS